MIGERSIIGLWEFPHHFMWMRPTLFFFLCWYACTAIAQQISVPKPKSGSIIGTVTDVEDDVVPGATVVLGGVWRHWRSPDRKHDMDTFAIITVEPNELVTETVESKFPQCRCHQRCESGDGEGSQ